MSNSVLSPIAVKCQNQTLITKFLVDDAKYFEFTFEFANSSDARKNRIKKKNENRTDVFTPENWKPHIQATC
jgi:hypothetical protein